MLLTNHKYLTATVTSTTLLLGMLACQKAPESNNNPNTNDPNASGTEVAECPDRGKGVTATYSGIEELFQTEIVLIGLEELGYTREKPKKFGYGTMHIAVANGDADFATSHWERLHQVFYDEVGGEETVKRIGPLIDDVLQGYLIDKRSKEEHGIEDLGDLADAPIAKVFDTDSDGKANLIGCNKGWGCEKIVNHHLKAYGLLKTVKHDQGDYFTLMDDTIKRLKSQDGEEGEPILYYSWTPLWIHHVLKPGTDVEWVDVPETNLPEYLGKVTEEDTSVDGKNYGFATDSQHILANQEFLACNPVAKRFFEKVTIPIGKVSEQLGELSEKGLSEAAIRKSAEGWIEDNRATFNGWLEQARSEAVK